MSSYEAGSEVAGRFVIHERIGEGGMGAVYRALQVSLDREVALKVLHAQNAFTARARRRFAREARAIARLNHPHIAGVYDFGVDEQAQTMWLAMELIHGPSLIKIKREPLDLVRLLALTDQTLSALSAAHARGIIHRDLKPSNVLLTQDNEQREVIKLVDFGLAATQREDDLDLSGAPGLGDEDSDVQDRVILGTPRYMAPEIFKRAPVDPRVDLYALGVMLYELISGKPPFPGDDPRALMKAHLHQPVAALVARGGAGVPHELEACIYRLLAKDPDQRYQDAAEVRQIIAEILSQFSYAPWMAMGPRLHDMGGLALGANNLSGAPFGGQTVAPASMMASPSAFGGAALGGAPLVGRLAERQVLEQRLRAALRQGAGSLILIEGEAGLGKSRLMEWVRVRVQEAGVMRCAQGTFSDALGGSGGLRSALLEAIGVSAQGDVESSLHEHLGAWGFSSEEITLVSRLVLPAHHELRDGADLLDGRAGDQERAYALMERVLRQAAEQRPLLIVLEQLHRASPAALGFLEHLAVGMHLMPAPLVILATLRAEELDQRHALREMLARLARFGAEDVVRLHLKRLSDDESRQLVNKLALVDDALAARLIRRAEGNPLHLMQTLKFLQESGKLIYEGTTWRLAEGVQLTREIPGELAEMMRHRVSQVCRIAPHPEAARAILERCAVLGSRFDYALLRHLVMSEHGQPWRDFLDQTLESLIRQGVLCEVGRSGEDVLAFDYALLRDVLLDDLKAQRSQRALHRAAAEAKQAIWGPRASERALELAEHYRQARDPMGVYRYTLQAARDAMVACDLKAAVALYRQAEEVAAAITNAPAVVGEEAAAGVLMDGDQVALELAHLQRRLGEYEAARQDYRRLLSSADSGVSLWARLGLGELAQRQGDYDEAVGWFEAARREAVRGAQFAHPDQAHTSIALEARCLYGLGCVTWLRGDMAAAEITLGEALEKAQIAQDRAIEIEVLGALGQVLRRRLEQDRAEIYLRRAAMLADSHGDREARASIAALQAQDLFDAGKPAQAEARALAAQEAFEALGKRHHVAHCLQLLGHIARNRQDHKEAAQRYRQAHRFYELLHDRRGLTDCKLHLANLALIIRRFPDVQSLIRDALDGYRAMGNRHGEALCRVLVGRLERELHKFDKAARSFSEAAHQLEELGDKRALPGIHLLELLALEESGQRDQADRTLAALMPHIERGFYPEEHVAFALRQLVLLFQDRHPAEAMAMDQALERVWIALGRDVSRLAS